MNRRRRVAVLTTSRAEYGLLRELLRRLHGDPHFVLQLVVAGAHLAPAYGHTVDAIVADGLPIARRIPSLAQGDTRLEIAQSAALLGLLGAHSLEELGPDVLLLLGDRYELLGFAAAALGLGIPIAHIHGGELSLGAIDDSVRHALTKLSSYHFCATETSARRLRQMGEPANRVFRVGALGVGAIRETPLLPKLAIEEALGLRLQRPIAVVTLHPETRAVTSARALAKALVRALNKFDVTSIITHPGADSDRAAILGELEAYARARPGRAVVLPSLGQSLYYSVLAQADVMVGNSSSGLLEAPSFRLPVVNVGDRQSGRERARNVIDCASRADTIAQALQRALSDGFRASLRGLRNPFGDGRAAERIARHLRRLPLGEKATMKGFADPPGPHSRGDRG